MISYFLEMLGTKGFSNNTIDAYRRDLLDFQKHYELKTASVKDIETYFSNVNELSSKTQARKISTLKTFFSFLKEENIRKDNPMLGFETPKIGKSLPKYLSEDDIATLINSCDDSFSGVRMRALLEILYASGLRVSELLNLQTQSLLRNNTFLQVLGKGKKERLVPIHATASEAIEKYLTIRNVFLKNYKNNWLFPSTRTGKPLTRDGFFKLLKKHSSLCGINEKLVSPHVFRHSFASHLLNRGANLRIVQELLGHEDIATTEIYTHIMDKELITEIKKHPLNKIFVD